MAVSATWKTRGRGLRERGTGSLENAGCGKRGVCGKNKKTKTVVNKHLPYQWLWTKFRQRHASLPKLRREKVWNSEGGHKEPHRAAFRWTYVANLIERRSRIRALEQQIKYWWRSRVFWIFIDSPRKHGGKRDCDNCRQASACNTKVKDHRLHWWRVTLGYF